MTNSNFYRQSLILFLFELGFALKFTLVGTISISEIFLLIYVPLVILPHVNWGKAKDLKTITIAYGILFLTQCLSEYMVGNSLSNSLKGLAITVVSYFHFMFLSYYLLKNKSLILVLLFSYLVMQLVSGDVKEEQTIEEILHGEAAVYLKFYLAPILILIFLCLSVIFEHKKYPLLFTILGGVLIVLGARSSGVMALLAGVITYMLDHRSWIFRKQRLVNSCIMVCAVSYALYINYVNQVLAGEITSGNNRQVFLCKNPYNPIELLMVGRSEMWVGWQAFMDEFWFGHGAWPHDSTGKYQRMLYEMHGDAAAFRSINLHYFIPSHSVWIGSGMMNGIFAFIAMGYILFFFFKRGIQSFIQCEKKYKLILVYYVFELLWTALFSPQSHFRLSIPIAFAIIFVIYISEKRAELHQNRI